MVSDGIVPYDLEKLTGQGVSEPNTRLFAQILSNRGQVDDCLYPEFVENLRARGKTGI